MDMSSPGVVSNASAQSAAGISALKKSMNVEQQMMAQLLQAMTPPPTTDSAQISAAAMALYNGQ